MGKFFLECLHCLMFAPIFLVISIFVFIFKNNHSSE